MSGSGTMVKVALLSLIVLAFGAMSVNANDGYDMTWHTIDCGGGQSSALGYDLHGTIGQPDAGTMSGAAGSGYTLDGGFWAGVGTQPQPTCPGDLNHDGVVDVSDLLILLSAWGPCEEGNCIADLNGDTVVDVSDLLALLGAWGPCT